MKCKNCNADEGKIHPIEGLKIKLEPLPGQPDNERYCQICSILMLEKTSKDMNNELIKLVTNCQEDFSG